MSDAIRYQSGVDKYGKPIYSYMASRQTRDKFPDIVGGNGEGFTRFDGTNKGGGFVGIEHPNGGYSSEITVGVPGKWGDRNEMFRPLIYEDMPPWEVSMLKSLMNYDAKKEPGAANIPFADRSLDPIFENSYIQAMIRQGQGKTPFYEVGNDEMPAFGYNMCIPARR